MNNKSNISILAIYFTLNESARNLAPRVTHLKQKEYTSCGYKRDKKKTHAVKNFDLWLAVSYVCLNSSSEVTVGNNTIRSKCLRGRLEPNYDNSEKLIIYRPVLKLAGKYNYKRLAKKTFLAFLTKNKGLSSYPGKEVGQRTQNHFL